MYGVSKQNFALWIEIMSLFNSMVPKRDEANLHCADLPHLFLCCDLSVNTILFFVGRGIQIMR